MASIKGYELKSLKKRRSTGGLEIYQTEIYRDGIRVGFYEDDYNGGYPYLNFINSQEKAAIEKACAKYNEETGCGSDLEFFLARLVDLTIAEKNYKDSAAQGKPYMIVFTHKDSIAIITLTSSILEDLEQFKNDEQTEEVIGIFTKPEDFIIQ